MRFAELLVAYQLATLLACSSNQAKVADPLTTAPLVELEANIGYPPGSYRLELGRTNRVRLLLAHILITHEATEPKHDGPMRIERSSRSRESALRLALQLSRQLAAQPGAFTELARRHSEDRLTAAHGGVLGVVEPISLPFQVLDALAAIKPGDISRVVESGHGFHIVQRLAVPPVERVAARRILIRYDHPAGADGEASGPSRTRGAALVLAESVAKQAHAQPEAFGRLVREYSDDVDREDANDEGDIGVWSTHEAASSALMTHVLSQLPIGGLSAVLETHAGFEIYQRSAVTERVQLAARYIAVAEQERAQALARTLSQHPDQFDATAREHCGPSDCALDSFSWGQGRGPNHRVDRLLASLPIGGVSAEAIRVGAQFQIYQRVTPPAPVAEPVYATELPEIEVPASDSVLARLDGSLLAAGTRQLIAPAQAALDLEPEQQVRFKQVLEELAGSVERSDNAERPKLLERSRAQLLAVLGPAKFDRFQRMRDERVRGFLMQ